MNEIIKGGYAAKQAVTEAELALINRQSLRPLTAEEVFTFRIAACDNQVDRDIERFTERSLDDMARLFVGRPVLRDHKWSADTQTARVYAAGVEDAGSGVKRLILRCYMLRSEATRPTIDAIEGGILREVSVGVQVDRRLCSICGEDYFSPECSHMRGREYDGQLCHVDLDGVPDVYEVSLCAVPAQREAGVVKRYEAVEAEKAKAGAEEPPENETSDLQTAQAALELEYKRY